MDNQTATSGGSSSGPINNQSTVPTGSNQDPVRNQPINSQPTSTNDNITSNTNTDPEQPLQPGIVPPKDDIILESNPKKPKTKLIACLCILAVLIIGGTSFAVAAAVANQPSNMVMSALNNLLNAKQISADGTINLGFSEETSMGIENINIDLSDQSNGIDSNMTAKINLDFDDDNLPPATLSSDAIIKDGAIYLKIDDLEELYQNEIYDYTRNNMINQYVSWYSDVDVDIEDCYDDPAADVAKCVEQSYTDIDPADLARITNYVDLVMKQINNTISSIDGQWIRISIEDVIQSDMLSFFSGDETNKIINGYHCAYNTLNDTSKYSNELSNIYSNNPFLTISGGQDSFYNISFDATNLNSYLNALPRTNMMNDIFSCFDAQVPIDEINITPEQTSKAVSQLPTFAAKFDGFFNHYLSELKTTSQTDYFSLDSDLKFSYPNNVTISAPGDSRSIIEIIDELTFSINESGLFDEQLYPVKSVSY